MHFKTKWEFLLKILFMFLWLLSTLSTYLVHSHSISYISIIFLHVFSLFKHFLFSLAVRIITVSPHCSEESRRIGTCWLSEEDFYNNKKEIEVKKPLMSNDANDDKYLKSSGLCTAGLLHTRTSCRSRRTT